MYFFIFVIFFIEISVSNSVDPDQTLLSAASDLGLYCSPMSQKWDCRLIRVKMTGGFLTLSVETLQFH